MALNYFINFLSPQVYFKKIFNGCPLKINRCTTWENPVTKGFSPCEENSPHSFPTHQQTLLLHQPDQRVSTFCLSLFRPASNHWRRGGNIHNEPQQFWNHHGAGKKKIKKEAQAAMWTALHLLVAIKQRYKVLNVLTFFFSVVPWKMHLGLHHQQRPHVNIRWIICAKYIIILGKY